MGKNIKGVGFHGYSDNEKGYFEVNSKNCSMEFDNIRDARKYYESLNETKACYDFTELPILIANEIR